MKLKLRCWTKSYNLGILNSSCMRKFETNQSMDRISQVQQIFTIKLAFWNRIDDHFLKWHQQMQETRSNSFGSKKCNTIPRQAKIDEHECFKQQWMLYCGTRAYQFSPYERSCYFSTIRNNCCPFLASDGPVLQSDHQSSAKWLNFVLSWVN